MSHAVVCWGCGKETRRNAPHPQNPHARTPPHGWDVVTFLAPEEWWELRLIVCSGKCKSLVEAAVKPLREIADQVKRVRAHTTGGAEIQDAEFEEGD